MNKKGEAELLRQTVTDIERRTATDLVVVLRRESGSYNDISLTFAAAACLLWLCFLVYAPYDFDEQWWPPDLLLIFAGIWFLANHLPWRRHLPLSSRFRRQVDIAARAAFFDHGVDRTKRRLGVLIYVSALEGQARILGDQNVQLPPGRCLELEARLAKAWSHAGHSTEKVREELRELGKSLSAFHPGNLETHELKVEVDS